MTRHGILAVMTVSLVAIVVPAVRAQSVSPAASNQQAKTDEARMRVAFYADLADEGAARQAVVLRAFADRHKDQILVEVHHRLPAAVEPQSRLADLAVAAAAQQARAWDMAQIILANADRQTMADFSGMAKQLELDVPRFQAALVSGDVAAAVVADAGGSASAALPAGAVVVMGDRVMASPTLATLEAAFTALTSAAK